MSATPAPAPMPAFAATERSPEDLDVELIFAPDTTVLDAPAAAKEAVLAEDAAAD